MKKYCVFFLVVLISNEAFGIVHRSKRQNEDSTESDELNDRYGWNRPTFYPSNPPQRPTQYPNQDFGQWPYPGQNQPNIGQRPINGPNNGQFPNNGNVPNQGGSLNQGTGRQTTTTQAPIGGSSTPAESNPVIQDCIRTCPVTSEYNPVCGSNSVTYPNPGRLICAQACGINVSMLRSSPCPATTTSAPVM